MSLRGLITQRLQNAWYALAGRPFGPGEPMKPSTDLQTPRVTQYPMFINRVTTPRQDDGLLPFEQLRALATNYDVASIAIGARIEQMSGLNLVFVAKDKKRQADYQADCDEAAAFWASPDKLNDWQYWLSTLLYEMLTTDASTLYVRPNRAGLLYGLDVIDGTTIKPVLNDRGIIYGYQQIILGRPESQYNRDGADIERWADWSTQDLIYRPRWPRAFTAYGYPPTEWIIERVRMALNKQSFDQNYFKDGNVPEAFASPPEKVDPATLRQFEDAFNALIVGNAEQRKRVHFLPWPMNIHEFRQFSYETQLDRWLLGITAAAYAITPSELGFVEDVNKANGEVQEGINERRGLGPIKLWVKRLVDTITQRPRAKMGLGLPGVECQFIGQDTGLNKELADVDNIYATLGVIKPNELRQLRYGDVLDGNVEPTPAEPAQPAVPVAKAESDYSQATQRKRKRYDAHRLASSKHQKRRKARSAVRAAIDRGDLKPAGERKCARCGEKASQYHHRTYHKKGGLDVEPVCASCNTRLSHKEPREAFNKAAGNGNDDPEQQWVWDGRDDRERAIARIIGQIYDDQKRQIIEQLEARGVGVIDDNQFWVNLKNGMQQALMPLYIETAQDGATAAIDRVAVGLDWSATNPTLINLAREQAAALALSEVEATQRGVRSIVDAWLATGGAMSELVNQLATVWPDNRVQAVAATAITTVFSQAQRQAWLASGVVTDYEINTANDSRVCPICQARTGKRYAIEDESGMPPFHYACRCDINPIVKGPDEL